MSPRSTQSAEPTLTANSRAGSPATAASTTSCATATTTKFVMAGLDRPSTSGNRTASVDARVKPGHDGRGCMGGHMKVGFIGLGMMGKGMAANLQKAGHQLTVHDL